SCMRSTRSARASPSSAICRRRSRRAAASEISAMEKKALAAISSRITKRLWDKVMEDGARQQRARRGTPALRVYLRVLPHRPHAHAICGGCAGGPSGPAARRRRRRGALLLHEADAAPAGGGLGQVPCFNAAAALQPGISK